MRHFLTLDDLNKDEILEILEFSIQLKKQLKQKEQKKYLKNQILGMIFEKNSTRTRLSFEVAMYQLGGSSIFMDTKNMQLSRGEPIKDTSRVFSHMVNMALLRVFRHEDLQEFAKYSSIPVINGLSDKFHPAQIMADYLTMVEKNKTNKIAYIGDANNITNSWLMLASKLGLELRIATPKECRVDSEILQKAKENAKISGAKIELTNNPKDAVYGANVVTTDTWISMGDEDKKDEKLKYFSGFCVDENLMSLANKNAIFLHCLPAYRGYEVSEEVFEKHSDEIFLEAENRLHAQKGILLWLERHRMANEKF